MFGLFPATVLPDELRHMATRIIFLYVRLTPPFVTYTPDMHRYIYIYIYLYLYLYIYIYIYIYIYVYV